MPHVLSTLSPPKYCDSYNDDSPLKQDKDILASYPTFATYQRNGCNLSIQYRHALDLPSETLAWAYHLCEQNMRAMYEDVWGWKPAQKQRELKDPNARFLLVVDKSDDVDKPVAYLHLRYAEKAAACYMM